MNANQVPDTPGEPSSQIPVEMAEAEAKPMLAGSEIQPFFLSAMSVSQLVGQLRGTDGAALGAPTAVGQGAEQQQQQGGFPNAFSNPDVQMVMQSLMANNNNNVPLTTTTTTDGNAPAPFDLRQFGLDPTTLSSLSSLLGSTATAPAALNGTAFGMYPEGTTTITATTTDGGYSGGYGDEYSAGAGPSNGYGDRSEHSGRGRRGRGRGGSTDGYRHKRKPAPCSYYFQGRRASISLSLLKKFSVKKSTLACLATHTHEKDEETKFKPFFGVTSCRCKFGDACDFSHDPAHRDGGGGGGGGSGYQS